VIVGVGDGVDGVIVADGVVDGVSVAGGVAVGGGESLGVGVSRGVAVSKVGVEVDKGRGERCSCGPRRRLCENDERRFRRQVGGANGAVAVGVSRRAGAPFEGRRADGDQVGVVDHAVAVRIAGKFCVQCRHRDEHRAHQGGGTAESSGRCPAIHGLPLDMPPEEDSDSG